MLSLNPDDTESQSVSPVPIASCHVFGIVHLFYDQLSQSLRHTQSETQVAVMALS